MGTSSASTNATINIFPAFGSLFKVILDFVPCGFAFFIVILSVMHGFDQGALHPLWQNSNAAYFDLFDRRVDGVVTVLNTDRVRPQWELAFKLFLSIFLTDIGVQQLNLLFPTVRMAVLTATNL